MGALASVIWNVNVNTKDLGGMIEPIGYLSGVHDRTCVFVIKPPEEKEDTARGGVSNPVAWTNFATRLVKYMGGPKGF